MINNYFYKNKKRAEITEYIKSKRISKNSFNFPLGVMFEEDTDFIPTEGYTLEFFKKDNSRLSVYTVSASVEKVSNIFLSVIKLLPEYITITIERVSQDANREFDILISDPDISKKEAKNIFLKYEELFIECGFVSFGIFDRNSGFEVFIDSHKQIEISAPYKLINRINSILESFNIEHNENTTFISDNEHLHYSLSSYVDSCGYSKNGYIFDYYDIVNNIKNKYGFKLITHLNSIFIVPPRYFSVTLKGLGNCKQRAFTSTYYIVADSIEVMETIIDEYMLKKNVEYYYIYDYYNVDPDLHDEMFVRRSSKNKFKDHKIGIWEISDIYIYNVKSIVPYMINKPYATTYKKSI